MKKIIQSWRCLHKFVLCSSFPGTPSRGERRPHFLVPCPAGLRGMGGNLCRQCKVLHGSSPSLSLIMCFHFPNVQQPALTPNASVASSCPGIQDAKIFWAPHAGGLCVKNLGPWKLISFDYTLFHCSWNMLNNKGWSQEWCNSYGTINQYSHCEYPGGKL